MVVINSSVFQNYLYNLKAQSCCSNMVITQIPERVLMLLQVLQLHSSRKKWWLSFLFQMHGLHSLYYLQPSCKLTYLTRCKQTNKKIVWMDSSAKSVTFHISGCLWVLLCFDWSTTKGQLRIKSLHHNRNKVRQTQNLWEIGIPRYLSFSWTVLGTSLVNP